jgi:radical SAM superfamily enzyme YgiQ (UPF0313 family)
MYDRGVRLRSIESVCRDFAATGPHVFVADDLFWYQPARSLALAAELKRRGIRKRWLLVQSRTDLGARHPELLEAWRPIAQDFDIFFGLEAATDEGLERLSKDATVNLTVDAVKPRGLRVRRHGQFCDRPTGANATSSVWAFVERHKLSNAGFTVLTPLPGTAYFEEMRPRIRRCVVAATCTTLWEPRLGPERFFELTQTWRRSVLNLRAASPGANGRSR